MTDSRDFESIGLPDDLQPEEASGSRLSRLSHPIAELLDASGGFRFAIICLCLMSLAVGLLFNRTLDSLIVTPALRTKVEYGGLQALVNLDTMLLRAVRLDRSVSASELNDVRSLTSDISKVVKTVISNSSEGSHTEEAIAIAKITLAKTDRLRSLADAAAGQTVGAASGEFLRSLLDTELRATRSEFAAMLEQLPPAQSTLSERPSSGISFIVVCFWMLLLFGTLASIVFLRLLHDEIGQRLAREGAERRADFLAYFDPATGLGNRFQLQDRLSGLIASGRNLVVMFVDIDDFRRFNDRYGRLSGDVVVREIAFRIQNQAEGCGGFAARLSGDDFAVVLPDLMPAEFVNFAQQISNCCQEQIARAGQSLGASVSIGVASFSAATTEYPSYERLVTMAEFALESAKSDGPGGIAICDEQLEKQFLDWRAMTERLPRAITERELRVYFQPQIDLDSGRIIGFESLIRWSIDERPIPASDLIRIAEQGGLIEDVDRYMLDESIGVLAEWNRRYRKSFALSVNISALHLPDGGIVEFILSRLERHSFPAGHLTLEITESAELDRDGHALRVIEKIRALGCRVSIDDFGTGYSSLGYLRDIGVDELKIDRSFVADIEQSQDAREFLKSVLRLPACLGQTVVVEGIETAGQAAIVKELGAKRVQGFLHGKPRPALEWLSDATFGRRNPLGCTNEPCEVSMLSA